MLENDNKNLAVPVSVTPSTNVTSDYLELSIWGLNNNLTLSDVLVMCKRQKVNVIKIGSKKLASKASLNEAFYNEINAQNRSNVQRRIIISTLSKESQLKKLTFDVVLEESDMEKIQSILEEYRYKIKKSFYFYIFYILMKLFIFFPLIFKKKSIFSIKYFN